MNTPHPNPQIVLSPTLGIGADEFAASWNATPDCREVALASAAAPTAAQQFDLAWADVGVVALGVVGSLALGLSTNALYDLLKERVLRALPQKQIPATAVVVQVLPQPDGSVWVVVHAEQA